MIRGRYLSAAMAALLAGGLLVQPVFAEEGNVFTTPYVSLGADISDGEKAQVLSFFGMTEEDLQNCVVQTVTNEQEHAYLDNYVAYDLIGDQAHSCALIKAAEEGSGIQVETHNINYCTPEMYQNALATAGVSDAEVTVAGGVELSGTAALIGVMEAYETMSGVELSEDNVDAAVDELVTTGELAEILEEAGVDEGQAEELIAAVKEAVAEKDLSDPEQIEAAIDDTAEQLNITLTEEDKQKILSLMEKISALDLDADQLQSQLSGIYEKLQDLHLDLNLDTAEAQGFLDQIGSWFSGIFSSIGDWFSGIFGNISQ